MCAGARSAGRLLVVQQRGRRVLVRYSTCGHVVDMSWTCRGWPGRATEKERGREGESGSGRGRRAEEEVLAPGSVSMVRRWEATARAEMSRKARPSTHDTADRPSQGGSKCVHTTCAPSGGGETTVLCARGSRAQQRGRNGGGGSAWLLRWARGGCAAACGHPVCEEEQDVSHAGAADSARVAVHAPELRAAHGWRQRRTGRTTKAQRWGAAGGGAGLNFTPPRCTQPCY